MNNPPTKAIMKEYARFAKGKPPRLAKIYRPIRQKWHSQLKRYLVRIIWHLAGRTTYVKLKWRWCRGEIKRLRLDWKRLTGVLTPPLMRHHDYVGAAKKIFKVEPLDDPAQTNQ